MSQSDDFSSPGMPRVFEVEPADVERRELDWETYAGASPVLMSHGQVLSLLPKDAYSGKLFVFRRQHMALLFALARFDLRSRESTAGSCWDVGANIGYISSFLAFRSDVEQVFAFEPNSRVFAVLTENSSRYPKIIPECIAVGEAPGVTTFRLDPRDSGLSAAQTTIGPADSDIAGAADSERVPMESIDSLALRHRRSVDFIKIDVEGGESGVLLGAAASIREWRPLILLEWHDMPGHRQRILDAFREASGSAFDHYRFMSFDGDGALTTLATEEALHARVADVFLTPAERRFRA